MATRPTTASETALAAIRPTRARRGGGRCASAPEPRFAARRSLWRWHLRSRSWLILPSCRLAAARPAPQEATAEEEERRRRLGRELADESRELRLPQ
eukprot:341336-Prymnesium_polylepis.1